MVDNCKHVLRLSPASNHSILNPQKWACVTCDTTESVWACLNCPNVACGRYISEHAVQHYQQTKHPLSLEVNEKYLFCYECNDYVLNDNAAGDVKILRCALSAVTSQSLKGLTGRSKRLLRSQSFGGFNLELEKQLHTEDRNYTVLWFRRYYQLAKAFSAWKQAAGVKKKDDPDSPMAAITSGASPVSPQSSPSKKRALIPGITGLRNLGNTCYMNSVLQVLSHLKDFRCFFLSLKEPAAPALMSSPSSAFSSQTPSSSYATKAKSAARALSLSPKNGSRKDTGNSKSPSAKEKMLMRQTTMECFQHINEPGKKGGLNGGSCNSPARALQSIARAKDTMDNVSLCQELHALLRVMWSGKWALVSPHKMLYAVWNIIPFFRGYSQQDAQEFLCEFLDKVSSELEVIQTKPSNGLSSCSGQQNMLTNRCKPQSFQDIVSSLFQGQLVSEVTCLHCKNVSQTYEAFMDLSLEFPKQTQDTNSNKISTQPCHLNDMLDKFTGVEKLDGRIYACERCNRNRRRVAARPTNYTEAQKRFTIHKLPHVLRLHLKRFMWSGRNNRGKITVHAQFDQTLDLKPFCHPSLEADTYVYQLSAVVMHHGRGFGSGHYTAYCWNEEADSWVHCNDAKLRAVNVEEVMAAQAYILFYTRNKVDIPDCQLAVPLNDKLYQHVDEEVSFKNSSIPQFRELKRKLRQSGESGQRELKRRRSNMW